MSRTLFSVHVTYPDGRQLSVWPRPRTFTEALERAAELERDGAVRVFISSSEHERRPRRKRRRVVVPPTARHAADYAAGEPYARRAFGPAEPYHYAARKRLARAVLGEER